MIGVGIGAFVLVMVVAYLVTKPFLAPEIDGQRRVAQLVDDRARLISQLRDLEMEFETGKLAENEYTATRARRLAEIEATETSLAEIAAEGEDGGGEIDPDVVGDEPSPDDVERRIAARKLALQGIGCPRCDADIDSADRFCRSCGAPLAAAGTR